MPAAYAACVPLPVELDVPIEYRFEYMIHSLAKAYSLPLQQAAMQSENDYHMMRAFENLESAQRAYIHELMVSTNREK